MRNRNQLISSGPPSEVSSTETRGRGHAEVGTGLGLNSNFPDIQGEEGGLWKIRKNFFCSRQVAATGEPKVKSGGVGVKERIQVSAEKTFAKAHSKNGDILPHLPPSTKKGGKKNHQLLRTDKQRKGKGGG